MNQREKVDYLHNKTNYGMMDCSKALKITSDDVKEAYKLLTNHKSGLELTYKVLKLEEEIKELKQELEYYKNGVSYVKPFCPSCNKKNYLITENQFVFVKIVVEK